MTDLVFEVTPEADGGYIAECLTESIFAQADTWPRLREEVKDAVAGFYFDGATPGRIRLRLVRDEVFAVG
jgi:hypothetical protein